MMMTTKSQKSVPEDEENFVFRSKVGNPLKEEPLPCHAAYEWKCHETDQDDCVSDRFFAKF